MRYEQIEPPTAEEIRRALLACAAWTRRVNAAPLAAVVTIGPVEIRNWCDAERRAVLVWCADPSANPMPEGVSNYLRRLKVL